MEKWYHKWWGKIIMVILVVLLIIILIFGSYIGLLVYKFKKSNDDGNLTAGQKIKYQRTYEVPEGQNYYLGKKDAPITIIEFSDFSCPVCKSNYSKMRSLASTYKDKIKIIYRDYPVISEDSSILSMAARCAGEQGKFWQMHDRLFIEQNQFSGTALIDFAEDIQINIPMFQNCMDTNKYLTTIEKDYTDGQFLGIEGTPTFFVNGYKIVGDISLETWKDIIEELSK